MEAESIIKDIEKESKEVSKWGKKKISEKDYLAVIIIISLIAILFFIYVNFIPKSLFNSGNKISTEIIEITADNCEDCFDVKGLADSLIKDTIKIKSRESFDYNSKEGKKLIDEYNLKQVPALILISNNIEDIEGLSGIFSIDGKKAIFDKAVPYIDLNSGDVKGLINLKEVYDPSCKDCASLSQIRNQLEKLGIKVNNYETVTSSSLEGQKLINENDLIFLPNLLISKNINEYWWVFDQIKTSFNEKDNYYVFKNPISPYKDLKTGEIKGVVDVTYLTNSSCEDCFNATLLKPSFQKLGIFINSEKNIDISSSEGKSLLSKYNIIAIPTVILSKGISDYESIKEILEKIGTFEKDNVFVLRKLDTLNVKYQEIK